MPRHQLAFVSLLLVASANLQNKSVCFDTNESVICATVANFGLCGTLDHSSGRPMRDLCPDTCSNRCACPSFSSTPTISGSFSSSPTQSPSITPSWSSTSSTSSSPSITPSQSATSTRSSSISSSTSLSTTPTTSPSPSTSTCCMVTCKLTTKSNLLALVYNGTDITSRITGGDLANASVTKQVTFQEVSGAALFISGSNSGGNSCANGGFSISCNSTDPNSQFNGLVSDVTKWKIKGFAYDGSWLSKGKPTFQTSNSGAGGPSSSSVIGPPLTGMWNDWKCSSTDYEWAPAWGVDLLQSFYVTKVMIKNRIDCCPERLDNFQVLVGPLDRGQAQPCNAPYPVTSSTPSDIEIVCGLTGRYVHIQLYQRSNFLTLCGVNVFGYEADPANTTNLPVITSNDYNVTSWTTPGCITNATYSMSGVTSAPSKLWASTGDAYAMFRFRPN